MMADLTAADPDSIDLRNSRPRFYEVRRLARKMVKDRLALYAFILLVLIFLSAAFASLISPHDPTTGDIWSRLKPPSLAGGYSGHLLGTDQLGRDILSRLLYGGRVSLRIGFITVIFSSIVGVSLGLLAGYAGGITDTLIMGLVDIQFAFPGMLVALVFVMVLGPSELHLTEALAFNGWMVFARMVRSLVLTFRDGPLVEAAKAIGVKPLKVMFRHILPNIFAPLVTLFVLEVARIIGAEAMMSFLGYGIQPPASSWGLMIGEGRMYFPMAWWLIVFPGIMIAGTVLALNIFSNWLTTAIDPLQKGN
ncbi:MAG: ABC transporter permease [Desulfosporosinus sp.]|nr:ABC transporter permease [Desulfosporosinus sp.]